VSRRATNIGKGLYAITPDTPDTAGLLLSLEQALLGGVRLVQYRNKVADAALKREQASALLSLCRRFAVPLIINDDLDLALALDAEGVHLGREDAPGGMKAARSALGPDKLLGVSCYGEIERAREAAASGADYVAFGALFPSSTKPAAGRAPLELFSRARQKIGCALCGIGGITLENAPAAITAGADLLAVISDLFDAPDIISRAQAYSELWRTGK
jgi:thiamine-phosphate pyrophosphorylase